MEKIAELDKLGKEDVGEAGYKASYLGELVKLGYNVPAGFALTRTFFLDFLKSTGLDVEIGAQLDQINYKDLNSLRKTSEAISELITHAELPGPTARTLERRHRGLEGKYLAVRSSATDDYEKVASWARELPSYLLVHCRDLAEYVKKCWAAAYYPRGLKFRRSRAGLVNSVLVQEMVDPKLTGSVFSVHPVTCDSNQMAIEALYGLAETDPEEQVHPDTYFIDRRTGKLIDVDVCPQDFMLKRSGGKVKHVELRLKQKFTQKLNSDQQERLLAIAKKAEKALNRPIVMEWAISGREISVLQVNPFSFCGHKEG